MCVVKERGNGRLCARVWFFFSVSDRCMSESTYVVVCVLVCVCMCYLSTLAGLSTQFLDIMLQA